MAASHETAAQRKTVATDFSNRRPAYSVTSPAITRHLVFRLKKEKCPHTIELSGQPALDWDALCNSLAAIVNSLRAACGNTDTVRFVPSDDKADESKEVFSLRRSAIISIILDSAGSIDLKLRVDVYTETFSLTFLLDRSGCGDEQFDALLASLGTANKGIEDALKEFLALSRCHSTITDALFGDVERLSTDILSLGRLMTDFRGLVLCPRVDWDLGASALTKNVLDKQSERKLEPELSTFLGSHEALVRAFAAPPKVRQDDHRSGESVLCAMLDGAAVYAAELGQRATAPDTVRPFWHLVLYAGHSRKQLGRLVRRLHVLSELRHEALMDYDNGSPTDLKAASREIRRLGVDLDRAINDLPTARELSSEQAMMPLLGIVSQMAKIQEMGEGSLLYRIEQSRYYATEFSNTLPHLRIMRIGDWQPYDDFAHRHILQLLARIDRIGNRYDALTRRLNRLMYFRQAEAMSRSSDKQVSLLRKAEIFAVVFLVYYVGSVLLKLFEVHELSIFYWASGKDVYLILWAVAISVAAGWLVYEVFSPSKKANAAPNRAADGEAIRPNRQQTG